jgi:hypothetical protein
MFLRVEHDTFAWATSADETGVEGVDIVVPGKPQERHQVLGGLDQASPGIRTTSEVDDRPAR